MNDKGSSSKANAAFLTIGIVFLVLGMTNLVFLGVGIAFLVIGVANSRRSRS